jgi:hypothetical protein
MENFALFAACVLTLISLFLFLVERRFFYLSLIVFYPFVGQMIGREIVVLGFTLNPSMLFGFMVLSLATLNMMLHPVRNPWLEAAVVIFVIYALLTAFFSPVRMRSISWVLKIATWLFILVSSTKLFEAESDLPPIHFAVCLAVVTVIVSFFLSWMGIYGQRFTYETGVESYGAGFSSGKTLANYLAIAIPVLALKTSAASHPSRLFSWFLILLSLTVIVLTFVRSPVIALLVGFAAYQFFRIRYDGRNVTRFFVIGVIVVAVLAGLYFSLGQSRYLSRWTELGEKYEQGQIEKLGSGRVGGLIGFYQHYRYRATVFQQIFGSGIGSSYVYLGNQKYIHNDFAEILMGCGVVGFALYLFILWRVFALLLPLLRRGHPRRYRRLGALGMAAFFMVMALHMTNITSGVIYLSVWAVFSGALIGIEQSDRHKEATGMQAVTERSGAWAERFEP